MENEFNITRLSNILEDFNNNLDVLLSQKSSIKSLYNGPKVDYEKILKQYGNLSREEEEYNNSVIAGLKLRYSLILDFYKKYGLLLRDFGKKYADEAIQIMPQYSEIANTEFKGIKGYFLEKIQEQDLYSIVNDYYYESLNYYGNSAKGFMLKVLQDLRKEDFDKAFKIPNKSLSEVDELFSSLNKNYKKWDSLIEKSGDISLSNILVYGNSKKNALDYIEDLDTELNKLSLKYEGKKLGFLEISKMSSSDYENLSKPVKLVYENFRKHLDTIRINLFDDILTRKKNPFSNEGELNNFFDVKYKELDSLFKFGVINDEQYRTIKEALVKLFSTLKAKALELLPIWDELFSAEGGRYKDVTKAMDYINEIDTNKKVQSKTNDGGFIYSSIVNGQEITITSDQLDKLKEKYKDLASVLAEKNPFKSLGKLFDLLKNETDSLSDAEVWTLIGENIGTIADMGADAAGQLGGMFSALGMEDAAEAMDWTQQALEGVSNIANGFANGGIVGGIAATFGTIAGLLTSFFTKQNEEIKKRIEDSKKVVEELKYEREQIENAIDRNLGGAYANKGNSYNKVYAKMIAERRELNKQLADAEQLKGDEEREQTMSDINKEIKELDDQIRHFAEDTLKDLMGIDLKEWANNFGDALVEAFASGEDAASAFDKTVADLMKNVVKNMASLYILEPALKDLQTYLFGTNGKGGVFGSDRHFSEEDLAGMKPYLDRLEKETIPAVEDLFEAIDTAMGGVLSSSSNLEGLSGGIKSITEDTANLLASYLNAVRADVALIAMGSPRMTTIAEAQLAQLNVIATNTSRSAVAVEAINTLLRSVTTTTSSGRVLKV